MGLFDLIASYRRKHERIPASVGRQAGLARKGNGWDKVPPNRMAKAAHRRDVPKAQRRRPPVAARVMADPMATLGHPARPRKRGAR